MYIQSHTCVGSDTKGYEGVAEYNFYLSFLSFELKLSNWTSV